jgi:predicted nucleic-acid-binding Zn-ribbon protein
MKCPKCQGEFEVGNTVVWTPRGGIGKTRYTTQIETSKLGPAKLKDEMIITTLKCKNCGYLENYASDSMKFE